MAMPTIEIQVKPKDFSFNEDGICVAVPTHLVLAAMIDLTDAQLDGFVEQVAQRRDQLKRFSAFRRELDDNE